MSQVSKLSLQCLFGSGRVFSSLWSNVSKVTSLWCHSVVLWRVWLLVWSEQPTNQPTNQGTRSPIELSVYSVQLKTRRRVKYIQGGWSLVKECYQRMPRHWVTKIKFYIVCICVFSCWIYARETLNTRRTCSFSKDWIWNWKIYFKTQYLLCICYLLSNWRKFCKEAFFKACTGSTCHEAQLVLSHNSREAKEIESDLFQTSAIHQWDSFWEEAGWALFSQFPIKSRVNWIQCRWLRN